MINIIDGRVMPRIVNNVFNISEIQTVVYSRTVPETLSQYEFKKVGC